MLLRRKKSQFAREVLEDIKSNFDSVTNSKTMTKGTENGISCSMSLLRSAKINCRIV